MSACEYLAPDGITECAAPAVRAISARHPSSDNWSSWPACAHHAEPLGRDLAGGPFLVTADYAVDDVAERVRLEDFADRLMRSA